MQTLEKARDGPSKSQAAARKAAVPHFAAQAFLMSVGAGRSTINRSLSTINIQSRMLRRVHVEAITIASRQLMGSFIKV
jgi:hypothetical protein